MSPMSLDKVAENYFSTLNPIAERISEDIEAIRDAYEDLWRCLSQRERDQIINETVIYPEAILKYTLGSNESPAAYDVSSLATLSDEPKLTGSKYIVDESTGLSWRDEHSAPFSWKTPSQIDLRIFDSSKSPAETTDTDPEVLYNNAINKSPRDFISPKKIWDSTLGTGSSNGGGGVTLMNDDWRNGCRKPGADTTPDSPNVVLGGTCSKISGLCSKLKFLPGKSFSYEVKTVVSNGSSNPTPDVNILGKIRASAVNRIQSTIKLVGGKAAVGDKRSEDEAENLVQAREQVAVVRLQKPSPRVAKPKSPPPPPPPSQQQQVPPQEPPHAESDSEKAVLLQDTSDLSLDRDSSVSLSKMGHELSDDFNSVSTECTPLSPPSFDNIPKSGFDFLDNW